MATGEWGGSFTQRVFRANISFVHGGQQCQTGFHLRDVGVNTLSPEDVATEVASFATTWFARLLHQVDTITGIDAVNLVTHEGFTVSPNNLHGTQPGTQGPSFLTVPVSIKGNVRKRYGNGRMLWPICNAESISGNVLVAASITGFAAVIAEMTSRYMGASISTSMKLVHLHDVLPAHGSRPEIPRMWYDATSLRLATLVSSLRRRKAGVGS